MFAKFVGVKVVSFNLLYAIFNLLFTDFAKMTLRPKVMVNNLFSQNILAKA